MADSQIVSGVTGVPRNWRPYAYGALGAVGLWFLYRVRTVLPPFIVGLIIAYILDPLLDRLEARGWTRTRAIAKVYTVFFLALVLFGLMTVPVVVSFLYDTGEMLPKLATDAVDFIAVDNLADHEAKLREKLPSLMDHVAPIEWSKVGPQIEEQRQELLQRVQAQAPKYAQRIVGAAYSFISGSVSTLITLLFIPITAFYFSREIDGMTAHVVQWVPQAKKESVFAASAQINRMLSGFFRGQLSLMVMVAITAFASMIIIGQVWDVRFGAVVFLALWYGAMYCVPIVGAASSCILASGTCFVLSGYNWVCALVALGVFWVINLVFDNLVTPKVVGDRVGLHPLVVLFAVFTGYHVLGILGMIIAVPIAASVKIVIDEFLPEVFASADSDEAEDETTTHEQATPDEPDNDGTDKQ